MHSIMVVHAAKFEVVTVHMSASSSKGCPADYIMEDLLVISTVNNMFFSGASSEIPSPFTK